MTVCHVGCLVPCSFQPWALLYGSAVFAPISLGSVSKCLIYPPSLSLHLPSSSCFLFPISSITPVFPASFSITPIVPCYPISFPATYFSPSLLTLAVQTQDGRRRRWGWKAFLLPMVCSVAYTTTNSQVTLTLPPSFSGDARTTTTLRGAPHIPREVYVGEQNFPWRLFVSPAPAR